MNNSKLNNSKINNSNPNNSNPNNTNPNNTNPNNTNPNNSNVVQRSTAQNLSLRASNQSRNTMPSPSQHEEMDQSLEPRSSEAQLPNEIPHIAIAPNMPIPANNPRQRSFMGRILDGLLGAPRTGWNFIVGVLSYKMEPDRKQVVIYVVMGIAATSVVASIYVYKHAEPGYIAEYQDDVLFWMWSSIVFLLAICIYNNDRYARHQEWPYGAQYQRDWVRLGDMTIVDLPQPGSTDNNQARRRSVPVPPPARLLDNGQIRRAPRHNANSRPGDLPQSTHRRGHEDVGVAGPTASRPRVTDPALYPLYPLWPDPEEQRMKPWPLYPEERARIEQARARGSAPQESGKGKERAVASDTSDPFYNVEFDSDDSEGDGLPPRELTRESIDNCDILHDNAYHPAIAANIAPARRPSTSQRSAQQENSPNRYPVARNFRDLTPIVERSSEPTSSPQDAVPSSSAPRFN
ncbi:hypothetical protein F4804DRAFT_336893 [Jackrogersella minutella]|nr:hypothetical protein F4804DRAFT_336893 [Jackrogersella minutella]